MTTGAYNPLAITRELEAVGLDRRQAEVIAAAIERGYERAASKSDLDNAIAVLRADMDKAIAVLRADIYRALWVQGVGIVAVMGGFVAFASGLKLL